MSEIIRVIKSNLGLSTVSPARKKIDFALSRIEQHCKPIEPRKPIEVQRQVTASDVIDLPRVCAVHVGKGFMSRYVRQANGRFAYAGGIKFTPSVQEQYRAYADNTMRLPNHDLDDETCPWCGAEGFGSIWCGNCSREVCYGKTAKGIFVCACGARGNLVTDNRAFQGIRPSLPSARTSYGAR